MGLRGPGAVAIKAKSGAKPKRKTRPPWRKPGLSRVERVIAFLETLPVTAGPLAGTTFRVRPWQRKTLEAIYAVDHLNRRPVRTAVASMGRKGGKTSWAAGLALCHLAGPEAEPRGEVYSAANDRFQASRIYNEMSAIITRTPALSERVSADLRRRGFRFVGPTTCYAHLQAAGLVLDHITSCFRYPELTRTTRRRSAPGSR